MRGVRGPLVLVLARARRHPRRWAMPILAMSLAVALAGAVVAEAVIVGDHAARAVLSHASAADRTVRLTWTGPVTPTVTRRAQAVLSRPGLGPTTAVLALNPARIGGVIVRPAAIAPPARWLPASAVRRLGACRPADCPMLLTGGGQVPGTLTTAGVRIRVVGTASLTSAVPLGYAPAFAGESPVLVTGDIEGLDRLSGLGGIYRTHNWVAPLQVAGLRSWQLSDVEGRLRRAQSALAATQGQFQLTAPFAALDAARAQASAAPTRLLLVGGGVLMSLLLFVLLSAVGVRQEQQAEIERLRAAGARPVHAVAFVVGEAGWTSGLAVVIGYAVAVVLGSVLAADAGEPVGALLSHSLLTADALLAAVGAWVLATSLIAASVLIRGPRVLDVLAVAAVCTLVVGLVLGSANAHAWTGLLVPLCCVASGLVLFRLTGRILRAGDGLARRSGSVTARLALVSLARSGGPAAAAIAFMAVSTALAGFALSFRATLIRGTADQAANRVPLDGLVAPGPNFVTPLELAPLAPLADAQPRHRVPGPPHAGHVRGWRRLGDRSDARRPRRGPRLHSRLAVGGRLGLAVGPCQALAADPAVPHARSAAAGNGTLAWNRRAFADARRVGHGRPARRPGQRTATAVGHRRAWSRFRTSAAAGRPLGARGG